MKLTKLKIFIERDGGYRLAVFKNEEWYNIEISNSLEHCYRTAKKLGRSLNINTIGLVKI